MSLKGKVILITVMILGISYGVYKVSAVMSSKTVASHYEGRQEAINEINKFFDEQNKPSRK